VRELDFMIEFEQQLEAMNLFPPRRQQLEVWR
jgi:hypothetical protein